MISTIGTSTELGSSLPGSPSRSPQRSSAHAARPKSPIKLTPIERKERDRQRQKDQQKRRLQAIHDRDALALALLADQNKSSQWHRAERMEEELVLRQLERDIVDAQRCHPAAVGYRFSPASDGRDPTKHSPVFQGYSPARCPASQAPAGAVSNHGTKTAPVAALVHPAFTAHCIAKHSDATQISPVFFQVRYEKIPLEEITLSEEENGNNSDDDDDGGEDDVQTQEQFLARQQGISVNATITKLSAGEQLRLQELLRGRFATDAGAQCLVCGGRSAMGCPGCFEFSQKEHKRIQSNKATQRLKTPKTQSQEAVEREARHTGLRLKLMGFGRRSEDEQDVENDGGEEEGEDQSPEVKPTRRLKTTEQRDYYANVLADIHAIRKHRSVMKNYVTLHIKTLPVGSLITLQVDVRSSIAYVYELYRANMDAPNRKIHLVLPTTVGLFYLNEAMENATDTRCGLVNGEFLLEDFNLGLSTNTPASPLAKRDLLHRKSPPSAAALTATTLECMLFSVAILSEHNTPQLVTNFLTQNFHFDHDDDDDGTIGTKNRGLCMEYATTKLPRVVAQDLYQTRLIPHVHSMKQFTKMSKQLERLEHERERERLLWVAYQERKLAKLEQKKKQLQRNQGDGAGQHKSRKVVRALAYLEFVLESTANAQRARVTEERLAKLWQCAQFLEEWKLCKHGRLIDAESTVDTRQLVQRLSDATVAAFDKLLERAPGCGPLLYPIQCVGNARSGKQRLVVKIGVRLGSSSLENQEYGLVLDLEQTQDQESDPAQENGANTADVEDDNRQRMRKRGFTKKQLLAQAEEDTKRKETAASWRCGDWEWKLKLDGSTSSSAAQAPAQLFTGTDLLRPPFLGFPWPRVVAAYSETLTSLVFQLAKLDEFNALARVVQNEDAQLSKTQIEKWSSDVETFHTGLLALAESSSPLLKTSALLRATQRVLIKQGPAVLKKRLRQRKQKMREREQELERLRELQEQLGKPKLSVVQQLKHQFIVEKAPKIQTLLELTPAEKLKQKAEQLLGVVANKASQAAQAAKKEYTVRTL